MYCTLHKGLKGAGFTRQDEGDLWVCSVCRFPTRMVFTKVTDRRVPLNAKSILSVFGHDNGTFTVRFALTDGSIKPVMYYRPYPPKVDMNTPRDLLLKFWQSLDESIDRIRGGKIAELELEKTRAMTYAQMLAEIMSPFYDSPDAVLRESMKRWQARSHGETYESPGLAESIWDPNTRFDGTPYSVENEQRVRSGGRVAVAERPTGNKVPDHLVEQLKGAIEQGMFTTKQIAQTYSMNESEVKAQLGLV